MDSLWGPLGALFISYILGSFPSGKLVALYYGRSIEQEGSGNVGATNVARVLGKKAGVITLILDCLKGIFGVFIGSRCGLEPSWVVLAVVAGHCISWPGMRGGKGVATSLGALLYFDTLLAIFLLLTFVIVYRIKKTVSIAAISSAVVLPIFAVIMSISGLLSVGDIVPMVGLAMLVIVRHKDNIKRLLDGEEKPFSMP